MEMRHGQITQSDVHCPCNINASSNYNGVWKCYHLILLAKNIPMRLANTYEPSKSKNIKGSQLLELKVDINKCPESVIIEYRKND